MTARLVLTNPDDAHEMHMPTPGKGLCASRNTSNDPRWVLRSSFVTWQAKLEVPCPNFMEPEGVCIDGPACYCEHGWLAPSSGDTYKDVDVVAECQWPMTVCTCDRSGFVRLGVADAVHVIDYKKVWRHVSPRMPGMAELLPNGDLALDRDIFDAIPDDVPQVFYATGVTP